MSAYSILFSSAFVRVQHSALHVRTVHSSERTNFTFRSLFIPLSIQIGRATIDRALFSWPFQFGIFATILPSGHFSDPRYLRCSTNSICSSSTITPASDCIFPIFRSLVCFTLNFSSLDFTMLLTFPFNLSASSCDYTQRGVVRVSQIRAQFPLMLITMSSFSACCRTYHWLSVSIEEMCEKGNLASLLSQPGMQYLSVNCSLKALNSSRAKSCFGKPISNRIFKHLYLTDAVECLTVIDDNAI